MVILASCSKEENIDESTSDEILKPISNDDAFLIPSGTQIVKDSLQFTIGLKDFDLEIDFNEIHSISLFFKDPTIYIENADGTDYFSSSFELKKLTIIGLNISKIRDIPTGTLDYRDFDQLVDYFNLQD